MILLTGGCQCGRVRFSALVDSDDAYLCHCRMCQRASGNVSIAFKQVKKAEVTWDHPADWYASSPIAKRPFCSVCGTPLGFEYHEGETMDLHVAAFDDPSRFRPTMHFGVATLHEAWIDTSALPRYRIEDSQKTVELWEKAIGKVPD